MPAEKDEVEQANREAINRLQQLLLLLLLLLIRLANIIIIIVVFVFVFVYRVCNKNYN